MSTGNVPVGPWEEWILYKLSAHYNTYLKHVRMYEIWQSFVPWTLTDLSNHWAVDSFIAWCPLEQDNLKTFGHSGEEGSSDWHLSFSVSITDSQKGLCQLSADSRCWMIVPDRDLQKGFEDNGKIHILGWNFISSLNSTPKTHQILITMLTAILCIPLMQLM